MVNQLTHGNFYFVAQIWLIFRKCRLDLDGEDSADNVSLFFDLSDGALDEAGGFSDRDEGREPPVPHEHDLHAATALALAAGRREHFYDVLAHDAVRRVHPPPCLTAEVFGHFLRRGHFHCLAPVGFHR